MINSSSRLPPHGGEATAEVDVSIGVIMVEARGAVLITAIKEEGTKAEARGVSTGSVIGSSMATVTSDAGSVIEAEADEVLDCRTF